MSAIHSQEVQGFSRSPTVAHLAHVAKLFTFMLLGAALSWGFLAHQRGPVTFHSGISHHPMYLSNGGHGFGHALWSRGRRLTHQLAHGDPQYLAACLLARDGHRDLREWVEYHLFAGFDKIFLFDHNSTTPMISEISDYVAEGKVQYTYFTSSSPRVGASEFSKGLQGRVYQQCFEQARGYYRWVAFTDLDEYMIVTDPKYNHSVAAILREYESHGAVIAHWVRLGSMGIQERGPDQGMLGTFTKCMKPSTHVKGIANLEFASLGGNAHHFYYAADKMAIRPGDGMLVGGAHAVPNPTDTPLVIYHYNGAISEWQARVDRMRGGVSGMTNKSSYQYEVFDREANEDCFAGRDAWQLVERRSKPAFGCSSV